MADHVQVVTTTDSEESAAELARGVVEARLGACVQVVPIRSFYVWEGAAQDDPEWQLQIKTSSGRLDALVAQPEGPSRLRRPGDHRDADRRREPRLPGLGRRAGDSEVSVTRVTGHTR